MSTYNPQLEKVAFWGVLLALVVAFFILLKPFYSPIVIALVVVLSGNPLFQFFLKILRGRRHVAAFVSLVAIVFFLAAPMGLIVALLTDQVSQIASQVGGEIQNGGWRETVGTGTLPPFLSDLAVRFQITIDPIVYLKDLLERGATILYQFSPRALTGTASFLFSSFLSLIFAHFLFVDGPRLYRAILEISPLKETYEHTLSKEIEGTLRACIYGYVLTALVQSVLATIGFAILKLDIALLLGLATFVMAFVPIVGTASVWIPVAGYFFATGSYGKGAFLVAYGMLLISGVDNILRPFFIQGKTNIHPVILFIVIFGGMKWLGPIGILAGPILVAVLLATLRIYRQDFR